MKVKISFNQETHRISKLPDTFKELVQLVSSIFIIQIPDTWHLEYADSNENQHILKTESDYKKFLEVETKKSNGTSIMKLFIVPSSSLDISQCQSALLENELSIDKKQETKTDSSQEISLEKQPKKIEEQKILVEDTQSKQVNKNDEDEFQIEKPRKTPVPIRKIPLRRQISAEDEIDKFNDPIFDKILSEKPKGKAFNKKAKRNVKPKPSTNNKTHNVSSLVEPINVQGQSLEDLIMKAVEKNVQKIASIIDKNNKKSPQVKDKIHQVQQDVHKTVKCDGCRVAPLRGIRYKCSICPNFDFCSTCEQTKDHPHAFIKIKTPSQPFAHINSRKQIFSSLPIVPKPDFACQTNLLETILTNHIIYEEKKDVQLLEVNEKEKEAIQIQDISVENKIEDNDEELDSNEEECPKAWKKPLSKKKSEKNSHSSAKREAKQYSPAVLKKANHLKQLLPGIQFEVLLDYVHGSKEDVDLIELMENLM